ncbi:WYL domain-containing protein [Pseudarthrobacter sp. AL07]|uniref:helix-turn-helix transcriptional regulator n=1 Tax=unclassified Pseudarthrobacter TaxID=2647000 RepID=UPI00249C96C9|nr:MULTISPECIES: WYL domain-containing protein [unclassified Pseudarthrobacter]MDI3195573.1 WYL domain-containing protein [Pseudarthrobacter sp. AL20]MDI3209685.1 WYL domain-containing protein [Pseudarthrobacter sp. AL07]
MSVSRTERLLNLLIALLNTKYGLRRAELRAKVYHDTSGNDVAFGRMFERDKNDLRQFGFDVETVTDHGWSEDDPATTRYRIGKESNRLPDVQLSPGEWTVLLLASQLWERAALGTAAASALRKLQASGTLSDVELPVGVQPRIRPAGQAFDDVVAAMHAQHPVSFPYLAGSTGKEEQRVVEPWGLGSRFGQWYLTGYDRSRQAPRHFRLSRFTGPVTVLEKESYSAPPNFNVRAELDRLPELPLRTAVVDVREGRHLGLRRRTTPVPAGSSGTLDAGYERLEVNFRDVEVLAEELASYGPDAVAHAPDELVAAVRHRLRNAAAFCAAPGPVYLFADAPWGRAVRKRTSEDQLKRLLQLVPFLVHNQGLHIKDVAARFDVTPGELESDLRILICSGLPEGYPDDLLDIHWEEGHVYITQDLDLKRPVRFTVDEACALLTGLETLNGLPELAEGGALESVTLKLMAAAGEEGLRAGSLAGPEVGPADSALLDVVRGAIQERSQLRLVYFSAQRDQVSERDVDPLRLYSLDNTWYFEAYCHAAQGLRNFRLDRVQAVHPNGRSASTQVRAGESFPAKLFTPNDDDTTVLVQLTRQGAGLADDYYAERVAPLPGGGLVAEIRFGSTAWLPMFVAQHGGAVRILEPSELGAAALEWIEAALDRYGG